MITGNLRRIISFFKYLRFFIFFNFKIKKKLWIDFCFCCRWSCCRRRCCRSCCWNWSCRRCRCRCFSRFQFIDPPLAASKESEAHCIHVALAGSLHFLIRVEMRQFRLAEFKNALWKFRTRNSTFPLAAFFTVFISFLTGSRWFETFTFQIIFESKVLVLKYFFCKNIPLQKKSSSSEHCFETMWTLNFSGFEDGAFSLELEDKIFFILGFPKLPNPPDPIDFASSPKTKLNSE